jgi:1,4-alpha-glucan branching enzyme
MDAAIVALRRTHFVLWRAAAHAADGARPPRLVIGELRPGAPVTLGGERRLALRRARGNRELWTLAAARCRLIEGDVYHYWFEVTDAHPDRSGEGKGARILVTDPLAYTVDWRLVAPRPAGEAYTEDDRYPASVIKYAGGRLVPCDAGGETGELAGDGSPAALPPNNRLVIYELPTAWTRVGTAGEHERGVGTFRDATALVDPAAEGANFSDLDVTRAGRSYLAELGVNAIELLPPADSFYVREWGYGTTNFLAPDFELGFPDDQAWPTPNRDLRALVAACHTRGIRFIADVVMAFARTNAYLAAATDDFFILHPRATPDDPDAHNSRGSGPENIRDGFGSTLFRYARFVDGYDPVSGERRSLSPARRLMHAALLRWMHDFHVDGFRMDSVENVTNWDFVGEYTALARATWRERVAAAGGSEQAADARFLVVGEELTAPLDLLRQGRLDALWNDRFRACARAALLGQRVDDATSFEGTVRQAIDCRTLGYADGSQAVNYLTSHDVEGFRKERLHDFFRWNGVDGRDAIERRTRLAFVCLLTAVGVPMILAGEEFSDQHDRFDAEGHVNQDGGKQVDPVNFSRLDDDWRRRLCDYVARLVALRTTSDALSVNDTAFIHADFTDGRRVLAWRRGPAGAADAVVVVANFSDFETADPFDPTSEYRVAGWPEAPAGRRWREVTQQRDVPAEWAGREPIFAWEAKVYTLVAA